MRSILTKRMTVRGFIVTDFWPRFGEFIKEMTPWVKEGRVKYREHVIEGLENAPRGLIGLLRGENFGKTLVRL
jgi:NADPH-dependent curcumin reductase CurA